MIQFNPNPTFVAAISVSLPGQVAGAVAGAPAPTAEITFTFRHQGRKALDAWIAAPAEAVKAAKPLSDTEFLVQVIADWAGVLGEDGAQVPYTPAALGQLLDAYPPAAREIYSGYIDALTESHTKN
jgi:hypothetical protein